MQKLRITGLVKAAQQVREQLAAGILVAEAASFRRRVRKTVAQVATTCREYDVTPQDLPVPSYRAYCFLRDINLDALPERAATGPEPVRTLRITGIVATQHEVQARLAAWAVQPQSATAVLTVDQPPVPALLRLLTEHVTAITALAQELGGTPAQLPIRSRRAYQWLKLLRDPLTLVAQLETQRALYQAFQSPHCDRRAPRRPVQLEFAYTTALYHVRRPSAELQVTMHAGFLGAPAEALQSLACAVLLQDRGAYRETVQTYATAPEFLAVVTALELTTGGAGEVTQGCCFDLTAVFARVNAMYFAGQLVRPRLTWNRQLTGAKFGHYDFLRDTVLLSVTLDAPHVPVYVVDFVLYHELLHKQLGVRVVNGRRYAHTAEFRAAERRFVQYAEAQAFLRALAQS